MRKILACIWHLTLYSIIFSKQPAIDTLLFSITLTDDTTSIYGCLWNDQIQSSLAGPVMMAGNSLLFYSKNGYVLYNEKGKQLDSYSLISLNNSAKKKGEPTFFLAYPLDSTTLIVYKKSPEGSMGKEEIYLKKIYKKELKKVYEESQDIYNIVAKGHIFNLAANSITDEMGGRNLYKPQLVGYTAIEGGIKWWSIDRLYSFTSPLIVEENGVCNSFFPGLKSDQKCEIQTHRIEPLGVYQREG
ncbi:MAG: hypothetical protein N2053_11470, partial [Chitinispirillaceae bacterium]|nr:hypothetical protein [Chitinispirillaceae bacterium]